MKSRCVHVTGGRVVRKQRRRLKCLRPRDEKDNQHVCLAGEVEGCMSGCMYGFTHLCGHSFSDVPCERKGEVSRMVAPLASPLRRAFMWTRKDVFQHEAEKQSVTSKR